MIKTLIKFCGMTNVNDIQFASDNEYVNYIGIIFADVSPRKVSLKQAELLVKACSNQKPIVGVFMNQSADYISNIINNIDISLIQFHGEEPAGFCESFGRKYIKAFHAHNLRYWKNYMDLYSSAHAFLIDSGNSVQKGGTGIAFDWKLIPKTEKEKIIVAGGINSSNVSDLLSKKNNIFGIDVNSGLESKEAIKDIEKIETFFKVLKKNGK